MAALPKLRVVILLLLIVSAFAIVINTNVMMTSRYSVNVRQEQEKLATIQKTQKKSDATDSIKMLNSLPSSEAKLSNNFTVFQTGHVSNSSATPSHLHRSEKRYSDTVPFLFQKNFTPAFILGKGMDQNVSVVIGIPSVKRSGISYLHDTLRSLFHNLYPSSENKVTAVVMLAETDKNYIENEAKNLFSSFTRQVNNGLLQVISPDPLVYPDFNSLPPSLGDPQNRVTWRSKEVYDAAYLMYYCRNKADYYLMLEDDVLASKGYAATIMDFAFKHRDSDYLYLSFSVFNSIGKLFRKADIPIWVTYFLTFYGVKPIDWLMNDFALVKYCNPELSTKDCENLKKAKKPQHKAIFQHIGKQSSLDGKNQKLRDSKFSSNPTIPNQHHNPAANITSTMKTTDSNIEDWYADSGGMNKHYYVSNTSANQHLTIHFKTDSIISKILVKTGSTEGKDKLNSKSAVLEILSKSFPDKNYEICSAFDENGEAECRFDKKVITSIRIRVVRNFNSNAWFDLIYIS